MNENRIINTIQEFSTYWVNGNGNKMYDFLTKQEGASRDSFIQKINFWLNNNYRPKKIVDIQVIKETNTYIKANVILEVPNVWNIENNFANFIFSLIFTNNEWKIEDIVCTEKPKTISLSSKDVAMIKKTTEKFCQYWLKGDSFSAFNLFYQDEKKLMPNYSVFFEKNNKPTNIRDIGNVIISNSGQVEIKVNVDFIERKGIPFIFTFIEKENNTLLISSINQIGVSILYYKDNSPEIKAIKNIVKRLISLLKSGNIKDIYYLYSKPHPKGLTGDEFIDGFSLNQELFKKIEMLHIFTPEFINNQKAIVRFQIINTENSKIFTYKINIKKGIDNLLGIEEIKKWRFYPSKIDFDKENLNITILIENFFSNLNAGKRTFLNETMDSPFFISPLYRSIEIIKIDKPVFYTTYKASIKVRVSVPESWKIKNNNVLFIFYVKINKHLKWEIVNMDIYRMEE